MVASLRLLEKVVFYALLLFMISCQMGERKQPRSRPHSKEQIKDVQEIQNPELQPQIEKPVFLEQEPRKLGLILGPGGALSFAQIGFLQELENQKISVYAVAGIEWGALIAGAYALEKKAHGIEWKLLKLPHDKFENKGFFSSGKSAVEVAKFEPYLKDVFGGHRFDDLEIPFTCPFIIISKEQRVLRTRGAMASAIRSCWPSTPHFEVDRVGADHSSVARLAHYLREQGADLIVYVDVLSKNQVMSAARTRKKPDVALATVEKGGMVDLFVPPLVDRVVTLQISGKNVDSYKDLRSIIRMGQTKSKSSVRDMVKQYAY